MARDGTLRVRIIGDSAPFESTLGGMGKKVAAFGAAAAAAVGGMAVFSVKKFADFDGAMQKSVAIMGDVSDTMRGRMSDAAREVGKTTRFSAEEAAESYFFLASAGLDAAQSIEALPRVAAFAQAGAFDMAQATDLLTDAQSALGLTSDDSAESLENMTRVSDVLVKANTLANASVEQFATSLTSKAGNALKSVNKDVEEGVAVLSVFADQGIKGERAGTLLTNTLQGLSENARKNAGEFAKLGVEVFDADGEMRNMADIVGDLEGGLEGMSTEQREAALAGLGFNKQAREGILALLGNSEALREYEADLRGAGGTTDEVAEKQLQNFNDQLGLLRDQFVDVALGVGEQLMPYLMRFVELLQDNMPAIEAFTENALRVMAVVIGDVLVPAFMWLVDTVQTVIGWFQTGHADITKSTSGLAADLTAIWDRIRSMIGSAIDAISAIFRFFRDFAVDLWERFGEHILGYLTRTWNRIKTVIDAALRVIQGVFDIFAGAFTGDWSRVWDGIKNIFSGVWDIIKAMLAQFLDAIGTMIGAAVAAISAVWSAAWDRIKQFFGAIWDGITGALSAAVAGITGAFSSMRDSLVQTAGNARDRVVEFFGGLKDGALAQVDALLDRVRGIKDDVLGFFSDAGTWLLNAGKQILRGLTDGIKAMASAPVDAVKGVASRIRNLLPGSPVKEGPLRTLNRGHAGSQILKMVGQGMEAQIPQLTALAERAARAAMPPLEPVTIPRATVPEPQRRQSNSSSSGDGQVARLLAEQNQLLRRLTERGLNETHVHLESHGNVGDDAQHARLVLGR